MREATSCRLFSPCRHPWGGLVPFGHLGDDRLVEAPAREQSRSGWITNRRPTGERHGFALSEGRRGSRAAAGSGAGGGGRTRARGADATRAGVASTSWPPRAVSSSLEGGRRESVSRRAARRRRG